MLNDIEYTDEEIRQQLKRSLLRMTNDEKAGLASLIQVDLLKELSFNLSNLSSITQQQWKSTITKLKNYKRLIKIDGDTFGDFIDKLLPLLGAYLGCMFTFKNNMENTIAAGTPETLVLGTDRMTVTHEQYKENVERQNQVYGSPQGACEEGCEVITSHPICKRRNHYGNSIFCHTEVDGAV